MKLIDLCKDCFPPEVYQAWEKDGIRDALPVQEAAVQNGIFAGQSLLVIAPTSSGKTFLGEMLALSQAVRGSRSIYLVPFKAIAEERYSELVSRYTVQTTAKESNTKYVDSKKAGDVIPQSARYDAKGFICIGRPDFETLAREQAGHLGLKYNYKQIPVFILAELFVLTKEGRISNDEVEKLLLNERGYISLDRIRVSVVKV